MEQEIEKYLNGEMTKEETIVFLKKIDRNPDAKEALTLYQEMNTIYDSENWNLTDKKPSYKKVREYEEFFKGDKGASVKDAIVKAEQSYFEEPQTSKMKRIFLYVGGVAAIFIAGLFLLGQFNKDVDNSQLYVEYKDWDVLPSLNQRDSTTELVNIEKLFKSKKYDESLILIEKLTLENNQELNSQILLYLGANQLELNKNEDAIESFTKLLKNNSLDSSKAHWYLGLCFLKINQLEKAKNEFKSLINSGLNFKKIEAKELLEQLD
ncbi:tetratricopeptide repeat protein [Aquimarina sp. LLG6339-5]|uniref:tetratricopeptide repeat protein n=1 Tax=Aquimarina sp. LLG6339-5 TaxID=3160830 RepID=UPI003865E97D